MEVLWKDAPGHFAQDQAAEVVACPGIKFALALDYLDPLYIHHLLGWFLVFSLAAIIAAPIQQGVLFGGKLAHGSKNKNKFQKIRTQANENLQPNLVSCPVH